MLINTANLDAIRVGFKATFQGALDQAESEYTKIATVVPSSAGSEKYGWLGKIPSVRPWLGERQVQNLMEHDYTIKNLDYELTIGVDRNDIEDDTLGIYAPIFTEFGDSVAAWPDELVFNLLKNGFTQDAYDGQFFFDTDHPVIDKAGVSQSVSNFAAGANPAWYLLATKRAIKPIIWQVRKPGEFVAMDRPTDENVFNNKQFKYGWDGRGAAGYGLWQLAYASKEALTSTTYAAAVAAMKSMTGDGGRPLNVKPDTLLVDPSNESIGKSLLTAELTTGGETNIHRNSADLMVSQWLVI